MAYEPASQIGRRAAGLPADRPYSRADGGGYLPLTGRIVTGKAAEDLANVEPALLMECVCAAVAAGHGVTISATSDGGALSVTLLHRDGRFRDYAAGTEAITAALLAVRDLCAPPVHQEPPVRAKRAR